MPGNYPLAQEASSPPRHIILSMHDLSSQESQTVPLCTFLLLAGRVRGLSLIARVQQAPSLSPSILVAGFEWAKGGKGRGGRLPERHQSDVGLPLLLSCSGCRRQWRQMFEATPSRSAGVASFCRQVEEKPRAVNGALWLRAERASRPWPALSHRPGFLVPRHFPKHPLISRTDHERLFHPPLLFLARCPGPLVHFLPHPALYLGKLW